MSHFQVGWLRAEDQTVLTLDKRVVTHNSRISVSQDPDRDMWRLHIRQIKYSDRGCYMCQINTTNMKKQVGCIDVQGEFGSVIIQFFFGFSFALFNRFMEKKETGKTALTSLYTLL